MIKREAKEHSTVEAWMRHFLQDRHGCAIELKHLRGRPALPFSDLDPEQKEKLLAYSQMFVWKLDDAGYRKKPFDFIGASGGAAFVAVRYPKIITIIFILDWVEEEERSVRRSLTEERAKAIAYDVIHIRA